MNTMPAALAPARIRTRRRVFTLSLLAAIVGVLALRRRRLRGLLDARVGRARRTPTSIDTLYKIILAVAAVVFVGVEGVLLYSMIKFRTRPDAVPAQIRGNTRLEIGWTLGAAVILVVLAVVTFAMLDDIRNPPNSDADGFPTAAHRERPERLGLPAAAAQRPRAEHRGQRPALRLALHVSRRRHEHAQQRLRLRDALRPDEDDGDADDQGPGRRPLLVDPGPRRQGRRAPGPSELHVVQDAGAGHLQGPVRRAVRPQPRRHDRQGRRARAGRVQGLDGAQEDRDQGRQRSRRARAAPRSPSSSKRVSRRSPKSFRRKAKASRSHGNHRHRRPGARDHRPRGHARAARLGLVGDDDRSQADRDPLPRHDVRLLPDGRRRGAAHARPARRAGQHVPRAGDVQRAVHAARHDDDLPVRRADHGRLRQLLPAAHDRRARHGVPEAQRAVVLAAALRRDRLLRLAVLRAAGGRLDVLRPAERARRTPRRAASTRGSSSSTSPASPRCSARSTSTRRSPTCAPPAWAGAACRCSSGRCWSTRSC